MAISKLKKIVPLSAGLIVGLINAIVGLITGILLAINLPGVTNILASYAGLQGVTIPMMPSGTRILLIIAYPISGFIVGFLGAFITAWLYNLVAKKVPLKIEIK